jgi:uncharacterized protein
VFAPVPYANAEQDNINAITKAAEQGDAGAQWKLGEMYILGLGVLQDDAKAAHWYRQAAEQGNAEVQVILGSMYERGQGVTKSYAEAVHWYYRAAEQGDVNGFSKLAIFAKQGNTGAQILLGNIYKRGKVVVRDYAKAVHWYRQGAEQGDALAQLSLGAMYFNGLGVLQNYVQAYAWFSLSAAQGRKGAATRRNEVAELMSRDQIADGQKLAPTLQKNGWVWWSRVLNLL